MRSRPAWWGTTAAEPRPPLPEWTACLGPSRSGSSSTGRWYPGCSPWRLWEGEQRTGWGAPLDVSWCTVGTTREPLVLKPSPGSSSPQRPYQGLPGLPGGQAVPPLGWGLLTHDILIHKCQPIHSPPGCLRTLGKHKLHLTHPAGQKTRWSVASCMLGKWLLHVPTWRSVWGHVVSGKATQQWPTVLEMPPRATKAGQVPRGGEAGTAEAWTPPQGLETRQTWGRGTGLHSQVGYGPAQALAWAKATSWPDASVTWLHRAAASLPLPPPPHPRPTRSSSQTTHGTEDKIQSYQSQCPLLQATLPPHPVLSTSQAGLNLPGQPTLPPLAQAATLGLHLLALCCPNSLARLTWRRRA